MLYLHHLAPAWHSISFIGRRAEVLLFHWDVLRYFKVFELSSEPNMNPYSKADFAAHRKFSGESWNESMETVSTPGFLDNLVTF